MTRGRFVGRAAGIAALTMCLAQSVLAVPQPGPEMLGSVRIPRKVLADGQSLAPGTYTARLSTASVTPVLGQPAGAARWVEFVQGEEVKGRELATVVMPADAKRVVKEGPPPAPGHSRVDVLKGGDYLRVWINRDGTHYLIHLAVAPS